MRSVARRAEGFTLIELLLSMTILAIIAGVAYSSFTHALTVYQRDALQLALTESLRIGLDEVTRDLTNAVVSTDDAALQFYFDDVPGNAQGQGRDVISFVTTVQPPVESSLEPPLSSTPPSLRTTTGGTTQSGTQEESVPTDILRVAYVIGPDPATVTQMTSSATGSGQTGESLLRITSTTLDLEEAFGDALIQNGTSMLTTLEERGATVEPILDWVSSFDLAFYDGEEWLSTWDTEEQGVPRAVRAALTVQDSGGKGVTYTRSSTAALMLNPGGAAPSGGGATSQGGAQPPSGGQPPSGPPGGPPPGGG